MAPQSLGPHTRRVAHPPCLLTWQGEWKLSWKDECSQVKMLTTQALTTRAQDLRVGGWGSLSQGQDLLQAPPSLSTGRCSLAPCDPATQGAIVFHSPTVLANRGPPPLPIHVTHTLSRAPQVTAKLAWGSVELKVQGFLLFCLRPGYGCGIFFFCQLPVISITESGIYL